MEIINLKEVDGLQKTQMKTGVVLPKILLMGLLQLIKEVHNLEKIKRHHLMNKKAMHNLEVQ